ncbi:MAG: PQQ-dependent sugar dehydrogenase [Pseudomonadota bacterium]
MNKRVLLAMTLVLGACGTNSDSSVTENSGASNTDSSAVKLPGKPPFEATSVATFDEPWAMTFLPDGRLLVTEKPGSFCWVTQQGEKSAPISGAPDVDYGNQGGLGDIVLHPDFANNNIVYLSFAEAGDDNTRGAAVMRATLNLTADGGSLTDASIIWRQVPKVTGRGHFGHRIAFADDGMLYISSGERQKFDPSQDMQSNMGKVVRLFDDGRVPDDNPFSEQGGVTAQIFSLGHRNPLGLAFDSEGRLWNTEMGPRHGDELNLVKPGANYGYPLVSNGDHYNGNQIPDHDTRPDLDAPAAYWVPAISPAGLMFYSGDLFADWQGDAFIGGLSSQALVRVEFDGETAKEAERYPMGTRVREIEQGPNGAIWILEDGDGGRLMKLTPAS